MERIWSGYGAGVAKFGFESVSVSPGALYGGGLKQNEGVLLKSAKRFDHLFGQL